MRPGLDLLRRLGGRTARRILSAGGRIIVLEYPARPRTRYGHGAPPHPHLQALLHNGREGYSAVLEHVLDQRLFLERIARAPGRPKGEPRWHNAWFPPLDAAVLYTFIATRRPKVYLEIGSGHSTRFAARAVKDHHLDTRIVSVDPSPRTDIDHLCHEVIRSSLEDVDLSVLPTLASGDLVFIDGSHRVLSNSDVTVAFLELLPRLPAGTLVGFHDVFLPDDYPPAWHLRYYSEQYMLAACLLHGNVLEPVFPAWHVSQDAGLAGMLEPLWAALALGPTERHGVAFWVSIGHRPGY